TVMPTPAGYDRAMSDPTAPDPAMEMAPLPAGEFLPLYRRVEGWIDGDLLLPEEAGPLLAEIAAAGQERDAGGAAAGHRHMACFLRALETLIASRKLDPGNGRPALEAAREILQEPAA